jgi:hypothetical protein
MTIQISLHDASISTQSIAVEKPGLQQRDQNTLYHVEVMYVSLKARQKC